MKIKDVGRLITLAAFWGASFLFIRLAAPVLGPFVTVQLRVSLAAIALIGYAQLTRKPLHLRGHWKSFLIMGLLNGAIPFSLFAIALVHLNASFESILNATAAFFTAVVAAGRSIHCSAASAVWPPTNADDSPSPRSCRVACQDPTEACRRRILPSGSWRAAC